MLTPDARPSLRRFPPALVTGAALAAQLIAAPALWRHQSAGGGYSPRYALVLGLHIALVLVWLLAFARRRQCAAWLIALTGRVRLGLWLALGLLLVGSGLLPIEPHVREYAALNAVLVGALLIATSPPVTHRTRRSLAAVTAACIGVGLLLLVFNALSSYFYSPDEAHWADYALTASQTGALYSRTWLQAPTPILPGLGWSIAAYGQALDHIALDIRTGRVWILACNLLACAGVGLAAQALYGRAAGAAALVFALLSSAFLGTFDYRPDHQLAAAAAFALLCAVKARQSQRHAWAWHLGCGLLCTGAMQLHAAAIAFAVGFSLFYIGEAIVHRVQGGDGAARAGGLLWFGLGAAAGTAAYYLFNILPVGGLAAFVNLLVADRGASYQRLVSLTWPSLFEGVLIVFAFAFLLWRRSPSDRLLLGIIACVLLALAVLDTQGYRTPVTAFYAVAVGALLAAQDARRQMLLLCALALFGGVVGDTSLPHLRTWLHTGSLEPYAYAEMGRALQASIENGDQVVSSHLLIWGWPRDRLDHLISAAAEVTAQRRWNLSDPQQVWERVMPTVVIDVENAMEINAGLRAYMTVHGFSICERVNITLATQSLSAVLYRPGCEG